MKKITLLFVLFIYSQCHAPEKYEIGTTRMRYIHECTPFRDRLGFLESSNSYTKINSIGALGRYQFTLTVFKNFGIENLYYIYRDSIELFTPYEQELMLNWLLTENERMLKKEMKLIGKKKRGVYLTKEGLLGAAHLAGAYGVKKWIYKGIDSKDINGKKISERIIEFNDYENTKTELFPF